MIRIGSNISSLQAQRKLGETGAALSSIFERLASGQRINSAGDDAAGLAISENLNKDVHVYTQAIRNINDGVSALSIAEAALEQLTTITIRQKELAAQAANGTYSLRQRRAMNTEANALVDEFNRITQSTEFNDLSLLNGSLGDVRIQCGYGTDGSLTVATSDALARAAGSGTFGLSFSAVGNDAVAGDFNEDGKLDLAVANRVYIGNGDGTFSNGQQLERNVSWMQTYIPPLDINRDGHLDFISPNTGTGIVGVMLGNGNGTFRTGTTFTTPRCNVYGAGDWNGDGRTDLAVSNYDNNTISLLFGNGDGTFSNGASYGIGTKASTISVVDLNQDGNADLVAGTLAGTVALFGNGGGTFTRKDLSAGGGGVVALADFNRDGNLDLVNARWASQAVVTLGNGDGTFRASTTITVGTNPIAVLTGDLTGDGIADIIVGDYTATQVNILVGNGDGTFKAPISQSMPSKQWALGVGDFNGDGALDLFDNFGQLMLANTNQSTATPYLDLYSAAGARSAMSTLDGALQRISAQLGKVGSFQSRLQVALNTISATRENYSAAAGRILDADVAQESAALVRVQILQQAGAAVLAQANQEPSLALRLLGR